MEPLFATDRDSFVPSGLTRTGWNESTQHGGPPSGLLMRAIEAIPTLAPMQIVRFTVDLMRPVPLAPLRVTAHVTREGRSVQWSEASLWFDEILVARLAALRIRTAEIDVPRPGPDWSPPARLAESFPETWRTDWSDGDGELERFHRDAVQIVSPNNAFVTPGPGAAFARLLCPLVDDEPVSPIVRIATLADLANGVSAQLDFEEFGFINPDITVAVHRLPEGAWVGFDGRSHPTGAGVGLADTLLFDEDGPVGRVLQTQLIDRRTGA